ncbi:Alpha/Beta hydrolase protein [Schizophyllum amplum]|uniref:Alpha/Beta hydrolase protein n=1 Tax=Schizophyllum amplum TaxID=97359 RepID=A0A550BX66_9AGAR|nr:Alpha/Beta hydrolase protein [Auriculariopsis ampla]
MPATYARSGENSDTAQSLSQPGSALRKGFQSSIVEDVGIRYVRDSGVCETTPGVGQMSGYIDIGTNMSMWFWFFESRDSPETAPFTLWLNGGPGCSSMIGLFQENGPCLVNEDGNSTYINPYSWNNISNAVIYIDQPIGTGFSYGSTDAVNSTFSAAPFFWKAFQVLFESEEFSKFESREFIFATESYGGHYGPAFVSYFDEQNALIASGELTAEPVSVTALMINNGWYDPLIQNKAYVDFATNAPGYGPLQTPDVLSKLNESYYATGGCRDQELACYAASEEEANEVCGTADDYCIENVFVPAVGNLSSYDLRQNASSDNVFPPEYYADYLSQDHILDAIGAESAFVECSDPVYYEFVETGDDARTLLPSLAQLADSGMRMLIWAGDTDINCNWLGGHDSVLAMNWQGASALKEAPFVNVTIGGRDAAAVQNVGNFSFARVYEAGHEVPAFQPEVAFEIFKQVVQGEQLHSV